jgi:hypothetical protein
MKKYVGIWIDRRKAFIVSLYRKVAEIEPEINETIRL